MVIGNNPFNGEYFMAKKVEMLKGKAKVAALKKDKIVDKKQGFKEGSKKDNASDKKKGIKD